MMTITLFQRDIIWADPAANQQAAERQMAAAPKSDLYLLPEMWSTGFATQPEGIAESDESSLRWMKRMAQQLDAAIAGSIATEIDGRYYNRFYFVKPTGEVTHYDKRHLFTYGGEHRHYTAGTEKVIVSWRGVRFLLQVCYDLRFPIFARNAAQGEEAYDVALYVASWPTSRREPWDLLLRARAIENQAYVCGVNRIGQDPACTYNGGTCFIDAYGHTLQACPDGKESFITCTLEMEKLNAFRQKFPVLGDRDQSV